MRKFFLPPKNSYPQEIGQVVTLSGELYNHIVNSLRHREGDEIILLDGQGSSYKGIIKEISQEKLQVEIKNIAAVETEPKAQIYLAQALAKKDNFEQVLQKATEIGAKGFFPLTTENTVVKLSSQKKKRRYKRWRKIIREAARQSERGIIPELKELCDIEEIAEQFVEFDLILLAAARSAKQNLREILSDFKAEEKINTTKNRPANFEGKILVLIGPEGGFTEEEKKYLLEQEQNIYSLDLGPRILRTETAGPLLTGLLLYELGDI